MSDVSILERLSKFIDKESPRMATFLYHMWGDQQNAITYRELREAIMDGELSIDYLIDWQQDYSQYLVDCYAPLAHKAIMQAAKDLTREYGGSFADPMMDAMDDYISNHGGKLIREISTKQFNAINSLVRQAAMTDTMTVDQLAKSIRPCIGLTDYQVGQVKRFYDQLREQGVPHKKALERQMVYAAKKHRERAFLIAQTEMATAYNAATKKVVKDSIEHGIVGNDCKRCWLTADDERVCKKCNNIDGEIVGMDEPFSNGFIDPPAHPACRCAVKYLLKAPDIKTTNLIGGENDPEITDDPRDYFLPKNTRDKLDKIEAMDSYDDFSTYLESEYGICLDTGLSTLKTERRFDSIPVVNEQCRKIVTAIDAYVETFGDKALSKLRKVYLYDQELDVHAAYFFNRVGENDPLAGEIHFQRWNSDGRTIFHELAHAFQDSQARPGEDAITYSERIMRASGMGDKLSAYFGADSEAYAAEQFADAFGFGFSLGTEDGLKFIEFVQRMM